jgi:hypothetical protein
MPELTSTAVLVLLASTVGAVPLLWNPTASRYDGSPVVAMDATLGKLPFPDMPPVAPIPAEDDPLNECTVRKASYCGLTTGLNVAV